MAAVKEQYIHLMEKALSAYSDTHIQKYFNDVKEKGLTEHGFPRLTANIGIMIAHGRRQDLLPVFLEMMEFCCRTIPNVKAANDFSVREIVCCLLETEKSSTVSREDAARWRSYLAAIEPTTCYNVYATSLIDPVRNWALFTAVSEYFRLDAGIGGDMDFIELQLGQQLQWLDENGMYMDNAGHTQRQPIMYDLVPRGLFSLLLSRGYRGKYYTQIDEALKKAALLTLEMQSPNGEMAFGGRSNQFLHNEAWMSAVFEYEAKRYAREGDAALAARFKIATARALAVTEKWLNQEPIRHIKNRFPTETKYGCEDYAYFDKYMITVASNLWAAYLILDDTIPFEPTADHTPCVSNLSPYFHKLFTKAGGYGLEFDLCADPHYDASGLGRVHREEAPSAICLSCPCPAKPAYAVNIEKPIALSLCSAICEDGEWMLGAEHHYEITDCSTTEKCAMTSLNCCFPNGKTLRESYEVDGSGVTVCVEGEGTVGFVLPAFYFDGETHTVITADDHSLSVAYDGWLCRYTTYGCIVDFKRLGANRNGHYRTYLAAAKNTLTLKIEIIKM